MSIKQIEVLIFGQFYWFVCLVEIEVVLFEVVVCVDVEMLKICLNSLVCGIDCIVVMVVLLFVLELLWL